MVVNGTTTLEDRALPEPRTWRSEGMAVEAHNLSSPAVRHRRRELRDRRRAGVRAPGAAAALPIDLEGTVTIDGLDLAMGRVYLPGHPVLVDGAAAASVRVTLDAPRASALDAGARRGRRADRRDGGALARGRH